MRKQLKERGNVANQNPNGQGKQTPVSPQTPKQASQLKPPTEEKIKEIVLETLIELNLVPNAQKKKEITR